MSLFPGTRIGPFEVHAQIGVGGMGEVYRATDTRLKRQVAIKVLPASVAADPERLARFQREAEVLAQLNHPHIAQIYGVEDADGVKALVMELVEGPTLADRLTRGALPVDDALAIAKQLAGALEVAHEQGIIHRDLKPANIKVREDGTVKVLDFGLAKALDAGSAASRDPAFVPTLSQSPTLMSSAMLTGIGMILGTAAYMSPEQAKGRPADKRSDIWAFGCVLYEMLTGQRAFKGDDLADTLTAIVASRPDFAALPAATPAPVRHLIDGCLVRDRHGRIGDLAAAVFALGNTIEAPVTGRTGGPVARWQLAGAFLGVALIAAVVGALARSATETASTRVLHAAVPMAAAPLAVDGINNDLVLSSDGARLVYVGEGGTFVVRSFETDEPLIIKGAGAARSPFLSADGQWIGFFDGNSMIKRVAISGGPTTIIASVDGSGPRGASWLPDGTIIFSTNNTGTGLLRLAPGAREVETLNRLMLDSGESDYLWPRRLPGRNAVLFTILSIAGGADSAKIAVYDLESKTHKVLIQGGSDARYVAPGYLVYGAQDSLRAVPFDLDRLEVTGSPKVVATGVLTTPFGAVDFDISNEGTLVYAAGASSDFTARSLVWLDRQGLETPLAMNPSSYVYPRIAPDGTRIAVNEQSRAQDIWIWDVQQAAGARFTFNPEVDSYPVWMPDEKALAFSSIRRAGPMNLYLAASDNTGAVEPLNPSDHVQYPTGVTPDGRYVIFIDGGASADVAMIAIERDRQVTPLVNTPANERNGVVSADGRWLAYESDESGRLEIYVRPFPDVSAGRWQVSVDGGTRPLWARRGLELYYAAPNGSLMMANGRPSEGRWTSSSPVTLVKNVLPTMGGTQGRTYDVAADGRFLVVKQLGQDVAPTQVMLVKNWFEELRRLAPMN